MPEIQLFDAVDACSHSVGEPRLGGPQPDAALGLASSHSGAWSRPGARARLCVRASVMGRGAARRRRGRDARAS